MALIYDFPILLGILILTSIIRLYYYLRMFINRVVCLGVGNYSIFDGLAISGRLVTIIVRLVVVNWVGGIVLFLLCGNMVL